MRPAGPITTDIVLVGGGHAHVQVMTRIAMAGARGLRLTLVTEGFETPYSGMLPGFIAGRYTRDEIHIDLARLAFACGVRLVHARAVGLDRANRRVLLEGRPPIAYDAVSLNVGIVPELSDISGAAEHAVPLKPISGFIDRFESFLAQAASQEGPRRVTVVGGGAAGVEIAMTLQTRLRHLAGELGIPRDAFAVTLVTSAPLTPSLNEGVRRLLHETLHTKGIVVREAQRVVGVTATEVQVEGGPPIPSDATIVSTRARAPAWLSGLGLPCAPDGSLLIHDTLQSIGDDRVFAVGDCAALRDDPSDKAGVFAVRQGPVLAKNLLRLARKERLKRWRRQHDFLVLLNTGDGSAIGGRGRRFAVQGAWVWRWKDWIDRRFMAMFASFNRLPPVVPDETGDIPAEFRCGGCAAKVGPGPLGRALRRLPPAPRTPSSASVLAGLDAPDDAAVIARADGQVDLETVDLVRSFFDDPYRFGEIAALHALSDIHAMGGVPVRALAIAVLPHGRPETVSEDLYQLLAGARAALDREGVVLVGGHSSEGDALALGFAVTGEGARNRLTPKGGASPGDILILTKALGTGVIFAAAMRGMASSRSISAALGSQRLSNSAAADVLRRCGASGVTDVTGFGLAGHLAEMLAAGGVCAALEVSRIPFLAGAKDLAEAGYASSLMGQNREALLTIVDGRADPALAALLFDPQTSGGLLAAVPAESADDCVAALRDAGYGQAACVGLILGAGAENAAGTLRLA